MRGKFEYHRPYGYYRYALNVTGKYESDLWLGPDGIRTESSADEWPVSYHGTNMESAKSIAKEGFSLAKSHNFAYGKGIYSTPDCSIARQYAQRFSHGGNNYIIMLQNRVNPADGHLHIVNNGQYWISPKHDLSNNVYDIRPYGILVAQQ